MSTDIYWNRVKAMHRSESLWRYTFLLFAVLWIGGCAASRPVRHLSSDACLVLPESTTKTEVLAFMGEPDHKATTDASETWFYYKKNEDLIRKLPLIGEKFGSLNYEIVTVEFAGELVRTCVYRQLTPSEIINSPLAPQRKLPE